MNADSKNLPAKFQENAIAQNMDSPHVPAPSQYSMMALPDGTIWAVARRRLKFNTQGEAFALLSGFHQAQQCRHVARRLLRGHTFDGDHWTPDAPGHARRPLPPDTAVMVPVVIFQAAHGACQAKANPPPPKK
jgi:hypothetical protein